MVRKSAIILSVCAASMGLLAVGTPAMALPAPVTYVPGAEDSVSKPFVTPGENVVYSARRGFFKGFEQIAFRVADENGDFVVELTGVAGADGSFEASFALPAGAVGTYTVTATGAESGIVGTETVEATSIDAPLPTTGSLATTGGAVDPTGILVGSGALVLGAAGVVFAVRRRSMA